MRNRVIGLVAVVGMPIGVMADVQDNAPVPQHRVDWGYRIGAVGIVGEVEQQAVAASTVVRVPGAVWLKLSFAGTVLGGDPAAEGARIRVTSMRDGGVQILNGESLEKAGYSSVYFNGDECLVEVIAHGGIGASVLRIADVTVGDEPGTIGIQTICGPTDDRALSSDARNARMLSIGCTAWLIGDANHSFLTAGHCTPGTSPVMQFRVPLSLANGTIVNPLPQDQYSADAASSQRVSGGVGNDWQYIGAFTNSTTGMTAYQAQGGFYVIGSAPAPTSGVQMRITGYGTVLAPVSLTWNQVQKTHVGLYVSLTGNAVRYTTDTTGGNSGSPVVIEASGMAVGIHTHGGCNATGGQNAGTALQIAGLQGALAAPRSICLSGVGTPGGNLFVIGDGANNFGTANTTTGGFARISSPGVFYQGLAYSPANDRFFAINTGRLLQSIDPVSGIATDVGTVSGTSLTFSSLAFDPAGRVLYSITPGNGQLWRIDPSSLVATPVGAATAREVAGLDFDVEAGVLFGIEDGGAGSRLIRIDTSTGVSTIVGSLGAGIADCNGLAADPASGVLYTIDSGTDNVLRVNRTTGAATVIGGTRGMFGSQYGMAFKYSWTPCEADFNGDGVVDMVDYLDFVGAFAEGESVADIDGDGQIDLFDYLDFVAVFSAGC